MNNTDIEDIDKESLRTLHPLETRFLLYWHNRSLDSPQAHFSMEEFDSQFLVDVLAYNRGQANQVLSWQSARSFIREQQRGVKTSYELTELGQSYQKKGSPAENILALVKERGALSLPDIAQILGIENKDVGSAFGQLSKQGVLAMNASKQVALASAQSPELKIMRELMDRGSAGQIAEEDLSPKERSVIAGSAKKRGSGQAVFRIIETDVVWYTFTDRGIRAVGALASTGLSASEIADETGALSPSMLMDGSWKTARFRPYSIHIPPSRQYAGRRNPYSEYLDWVRDKLVALGFQEFDGPLVESEFWNSDALFMPQFHAARDIHDVYYIKNPKYARGIEQPYLDNVASAHENGGDTGSRGWGYRFDRNFTRRLILRSQGTVMSAKTLHRAEVPGKYFGILRCFRYDQVDATHLSDFYQTEGIVLSENANLRTLLGLLEVFAVEVAGASDVRYVPGYFPFTEPSVEVHIKHPELGWFELGGSGIFRPEVTRPMGVDVPVIAWGLGIDRMALMHLGLNDLRELFSPDIESVRLRRAQGVR